jgi:hypothetical protein
VRERNPALAILAVREIGGATMIFSLFQTRPVDDEDDIATGTYADGAIGTPASDVSASVRNWRQSSHERDYGAGRSQRNVRTAHSA